MQAVCLREILDRGHGRPRLEDEDNEADGKRVIIEYRWGDETPVIEQPALPAPQPDSENAEVIWNAPGQY